MPKVPKVKESAFSANQFSLNTDGAKGTYINPAKAGLTLVHFTL